MKNRSLIIFSILISLLSITILCSDKELAFTHDTDKSFLTLDITLGTPAQTFPVHIDTTSSISWVPSIDCINCNATTKRFNASQSTTVKGTNKTVEIDHQDGDVKGQAYFDTLSIQGLTVEDFGFVLVHKLDKHFSDHEGGRLGMGYRNKYGSRFSLLDTLKKNNKIFKKVFSISFSDDKKGKLELGDFPTGRSRDSSAYSYCNLTSTEDIDDDFEESWVCQLSHVFIGPAENFTNAYEINGKAVFDSGYGYISVPKNYFDFFRTNYIQKNGINCTEVNFKDYITLTCDLGNKKLNEMPKIHFVLGGYAYSINYDDIFTKEQGNSIFYTSMIRFDKENENVWVLGQPFLRKFTTVFNYDEEHVGFFGGEKVDFRNDWTKWSKNSFTKDKAERMFYLIVGASILGSLLFILILFIVVHSIKKRRLEEHGPLINERV
jgi:hypothetical protein